MSSPTILTLSTPASLQPNSLANTNSPCALEPCCSDGCTTENCTCSGCSNTLQQIFAQLSTDCNSILLSRIQSRYDSNQWNALSREIGDLVALADALKRDPNGQSLIYGKIMLIITCQYLPTVSNYIGDQISEQAAIQNMASDISSFIIEAETAFNTLSSSPDCTCTESCTSSECTNNCSTTTDCENQYNLFSGIMVMIAGSSTTIPVSSPSSAVSPYSYSFTATISANNFGVSKTSTSQDNIISFLSDSDFWGSIGGVPLSSSQASQINTALVGIANIFNTNAANVAADDWYNMELADIASAICSWTQPYGSSDASDPITTGNAPLVYTEPSTIQSDLNTAAQTVEGIATSTQTVENFQVQEIDQFYGITNSIQMSQEQQCASMVKQQTT